MSFNKPNFKFTKPKPSGIIYIKEDEKQETFADEKPQKKFSDYEDQLVTEAINTRNDIQRLLDIIQDNLDKEKAELNVQFDPNDYPMLYEAITCPHCFTANNYVMTLNGLKDIKDINLEDKILTSDGSFQKIYKKHERDYNGEGYIINTYAGLSGIKCTYNHEFYTLRGKIPAQNLTENDYLEFISNVDLDNDNLGLDPYVAGLYIAEGSNNYNSKFPRSISFAFHINEKEYHKKVIDFFESNNIHTYTQIPKFKKSFVIEVFSSKICEIFDILFNHYSYNKKIPYLKSLFNESLLNGIIDGDGYKEHNSLMLKTTSKNLVIQTQLLCAYLGYEWFSTYIEKEKIDKRGVKHKEAYCLNLKKNITTKRGNLKNIYNNIKKVNNKYYVKIKSLEKIIINEKVYNLTINDSKHNYTVNGFVVSNCGNISASPAITKDAWDRKKAAESKVSNSVNEMIGLNGPVLSISATQENMWSTMIKEMTQQVIFSVVKFAFQQIKVVFAPIGNVEGLNVIPKAIDKLLDTCEKALTRGQNASDFEKALQEDMDYLSKINTYSATVPNDTLANMYLNCASHINYWKKDAPEILKFGRSSIYNKQELYDSYKEVTRQFDSVLDTVVPNNYTYYDNYVKANIQYRKDLRNTNLPSSWFGADNDLSRKEGDVDEEKGVLPSMLLAGESGLNKVMKEFKDNLANSVLLATKKWLDDPATFCCLVKNLLQIGSVDKTFLTIARIILELYKLFFLDDISISLPNFKNLIYNICNQLVNALISAMAQIACKFIDNFNLKIANLQGKNIDCTPLKLLWEYLSGTILELKSSLANLTVDLAASWRLAFRNQKKVEIKLQAEEEVNFYVSIIEMILSFLQAVNACNDNYDSDYVRTSGTKYPSRYISNYDKYNRDVDRLTNSLNKSYKTVKENLNSKNSPASSITNETVLTFMKTKMNLNNDQINIAKSAIEDCHCDAELTADEIKQLTDLQKTIRS